MNRLVPVGLAVVLMGAADNRPPLLDATKNADTAAVRALLQRGANVNAAEADGTTALHWASYRDNLESADLLIRAGARVNAANDLGADPLFVHHGDKMVDGRGGIAFEHRRETTTALMAATGMGGGTAWVQSERGDRETFVLEAAKLALELGVDVNAANTDGRTALDAAKALKYDTVVKFLVEKGARPGTITARPPATVRDGPLSPR